MVSFTFATLTAAIALIAQTVIAVPSPNLDSNGVYVKRAASCSFLKASKTTSLKAPMAVKGTFDGKLEGGDKDAVFLLEDGATIKNVIIGANQAEGIHCKGTCNIYNVWFEAVCEDAITLRQKSGTSNIIGGAAKGASDKVIQHNGSGVVNIDLYCVQDFGKLYRFCGNCKTQYKRTVNISNVIAKNGKLLAEINSNYGDVATIKTKTNSYSSVKSICDTFKGNSSGKELSKLTSNKANSR
ncbi:unnamed protein product [Rhizoctonia solani]|uniref:Pectate lyase n=1 Tax=Rhizoctonia solani TaxID=456999 RepID=A0A8H2XT40_9AGAM|nr:unnamed protein product [Rhizoctonia solani]